MNIQSRSPIARRLVFGLIILVWILSFLKMVYLFSLGRNTPPFSGWVLLLFPIVGFLLMTFRDNARLRLHALWTPVGLLIVGWAWLVLFQFDVAAVNGNIIEAMVQQSSEVYLYLTAFGLFLAFVDARILERRACWFAPLALFNLVFFIAAVYALIFGKNILPALLLDEGNFWATWGRNIEVFLWYASGILFGYAVVKRLRTDRPSLKRTGVTVGISVLAVLLLIILASAVGQALPEQHWFGRWLRGAESLPRNADEALGTWPSKTCPDGLENENQPDLAPYAIKGGQRYRLDAETEIWIKDNCPSVQE